MSASQRLGSCVGWDISGGIAATSEIPFPRRGARRIRDWGTLKVLEQTGNVTCWFLNRDLKPCNVLVVPKGRGQEVKLLDFGFALIVNDGRLQMADVAASIGYITPEVLLGTAASEASDLFAVGVIAREVMLGGRSCSTSTTQLGHHLNQADRPARAAVLAAGR